MPFKSKAQQRYMFATNKDLAEEFAAETKNFKKLPEKVKPKQSKKRVKKKKSKPKKK